MHSEKNLVILVDEDDREVGLMPKLEAHEKGVLHRAISVFAYDDEGHWILQRRAMGKYHSEGLWSNTCCSHPYPKESSQQAAERRLQEEMGMNGEPIKAFDFLYQANLDSGLSEHELDHIFVLHTHELPSPNSDEVSEWRKVSFEQLDKEIQSTPKQFTEWFKMLYMKVQNHILASQKVFK